MDVCMSIRNGQTADGRDALCPVLVIHSRRSLIDLGHRLARLEGHILAHKFGRLSTRHHWTGGPITIGRGSLKACAEACNLDSNPDIW